MPSIVVVDIERRVLCKEDHAYEEGNSLWSDEEPGGKVEMVGHEALVPYPFELQIGEVVSGLEAVPIELLEFGYVLAVKRERLQTDP